MATVTHKQAWIVVAIVVAFAMLVCAIVVLAQEPPEATTTTETSTTTTTSRPVAQGYRIHNAQKQWRLRHPGQTPTALEQRCMMERALNIPHRGDKPCPVEEP